MTNSEVTGLEVFQPVQHYGAEYSQKVKLENVEIADESDTYKCEVATRDGNRGNMTVLEHQTHQLSVYGWS